MDATIDANTETADQIHRVTSFPVPMKARCGEWKKAYSGTRGPFLESPGNVSGPVSHPLSPRYTFRVFLEFPAIIYPVIFPDNLPGNLREVTRSRKVTGKQHFVVTQQNGCRRRTFLCSSSITEVSRENSFS